LFTAALCLAPPCLARAAADPLTARLEAALSARALRGARVAALVVAEKDGDVLYAREPDRALIPASNQKILTAIAALHSFGPTHRFTTEFLTVPAPDAEGAVDTLVVRGSGDPAITSEDWWRIAADLRLLGLRRIRGGIVLETGAFDAEHWHPGWGAVSARAYHAPVGAITANYSAYAVTVRPGAARGRAVGAVVDPPVAYLKLTNRASTGPRRSASKLRIDRESVPEGERVVVSGTFPAGAKPKTHYRSVQHPALYAASVLRMQLAANGIEVGDGNRIGSVPDGAEVLLEHEGRPLAETVRLFMKFSNNSIAEALVKAMGAQATGAPGSWRNGIPAMRRQLASAGVSEAGFTLVDGSGLSYGNRVSPRALVAALRVASSSFRFGPEFVASLPIAAADGTLEKRASGAAYAVRAKTGLLTRVTALSGYARRGNGARVVFSIIANGFRGSADSAMDALDRFVAALVD
jgi:D-alanyl-D-alanine carboxypeptidase/D-alanyl-D-alanine-endopeptidase (penicillin-binding protein 4)